MRPVFALLAACAVAHADPPKFDYGKPEEVKLVVWKASASLGLVATTGNSESITLSGGLTISRNDGKNKLVFDAGGAYARSQIRQATDTNGNGFIDPSEITTVEKNTAESWFAKLRYDRFFTPNNSGYVAALAAGDIPAGKEIVGGGQIGYSRHFLQTEKKTQDLALELGYDFSFVDYADPNASPGSVAIHSLRVFAGYTNAVTDDTQFALSVEGLFNCNPIDVPATTANPDGHAGAFEDVRVLGKASLTTKLWKALPRLRQAACCFSA